MGKAALNGGGKSFQVEMSVRDYELDQYGVVNNSVYNNYLEHTRHDFLTEVGLDAAGVAAEGRSLALSRLSVHYRASLRSKERFRVRLRVSSLSGARVTFYQEIHKIPEDLLMLEAWAEAVFLDERGRPMRVAPEHKAMFLPYLMAE